MYNKKEIRKACRLSISNIIKESITDVELFNTPFEIIFLHNNTVEKEIVDFVEQALDKNVFEGLKIHKTGHVLVPKKDLADFRKCALIDIIDEIIYLTMVLLIASEIEKNRINKSKKIVYSYRFKPKDGYLFDNEISLYCF